MVSKVFDFDPDLGIQTWETPKVSCNFSRFPQSKQTYPKSSFLIFSISILIGNNVFEGLETFRLCFFRWNSDDLNDEQKWCFSLLS